MVPVAMAVTTAVVAVREATASSRPSESAGALRSIFPIKAQDRWIFFLVPFPNRGARFAFIRAGVTFMPIAFRWAFGIISLGRPGPIGTARLPIFGGITHSFGSSQQASPSATLGLRHASAPLPSAGSAPITED